MRRRRRALAAAFPLAAHMAAGLLRLDRLPAFGVVGGYHPVGAELDPGPLLARLAGAGGRIVLPVAVTVDAPLVFRVEIADAPLIRDAHAVPSPPAGAAVMIPDIVVAPVLAFDRAGGRLGQGAGAFDRTLAALRARGAVFVLGLAYAGQEVAHVPTESHDERLDAILTETGYIEV